MSATQRLYRITTRFWSAVHLRPDDVAIIAPSASTTIPVIQVAFRSAYARGLPYLLAADVYVRAASIADASTRYATVAPDMAAVLAVAANAAILDGEILSIYDAEPGELEHPFVQEFSTVEPRFGNPSARRPRLDHAGAALACGGELDDRLQRALGLYADALRYCHPRTHVKSALRLYTAIENLTEFLIRKLAREQFEGDRASLARSYDLKGDDNELENQLRGWVRGKLILDDRDMSADLKKARNGFEHGFLSFREVADLVEPHYQNAMITVHRRLLEELPLTDETRSYFFGSGFETPLGAWWPVLQIEGTFETKDASHIGVDGPLIFANATVSDVNYELIEQRDVTRTGRLTWTVDMKPQMPAGVTMFATSHALISPGNGERIESGSVTARLNGEDITDQIQFNAESEGTAGLNPPTATT